ncbi:MAG TPA: hypothetical protein VKS21_06835 [Spirochaetota bacterium]|nr:hypothetical protein [Spirochaetota bacterium]
MKKLITVVLSLSLLGVFSCQTAPEVAPGKSALERLNVTLLNKLEKTGKARYVVSVFQDTSKAGNAKVDLSGSIGEVLSKSGRVTVRAGGAEIKKGVMKEYELSMAGLTANSAEIGNMLGADVIVFSRVVNHSKNTVDRTVFDEITITVQVEVKAIMAETGKVLFSFTGEGKSSPAKQYKTSSGKMVAGTIDFDSMTVEAAQNAAKGLKPKVASHFPLIGMVVSAGGGKAMTDLGSNYNVRKGDFITLVRKGKPITHPSSGKIISYDKKKVAVGEVVQVQSETCTLNLVEQELTPAVGDLAVLND